MILHIDMDAFYASVEQLDNPELRGKCVIVGGTSNRGVVSAASYEARRFGVHSAMPIFQARQRCPDGVYLHPRMQRYKSISRRIMALLRDYTPLVEPVSIDEAFMDISGCEKLLGDVHTFGRGLKTRIRKTVHLTCSVGIAPNRFLAKIASDMDKPDGLTVIQPQNVTEFIAVLPIGKVPGVGKKTLSVLQLLGIRTLGDVIQVPETTLLNKLGKYGGRLIDLSHGIDNTPVTPESKHKSVSSEHTLDRDTADSSLLKRHMLGQAQEVSSQLRKMGVRARTVTLKIKHADFRQVTRSVTVAAPVASANAIYALASQLLDNYELSEWVRLVGVGVSNLTNVQPPVQMDLFGDPHPRKENWERVDRVVDSITERFGKYAVQRASLTGPIRSEDAATDLKRSQNQADKT